MFNLRTILFVLAIILVVGVGYNVLTSKDDRNIAEKIGDAIHELPQGIDKAGRQLEDRTPAQKAGDAVKDVGSEIKQNTGP